MAKFIQNQSLLLLEKLNELDLDAEADLCEKLHDDAEHLFRTLSPRLDEITRMVTDGQSVRRSEAARLVKVSRPTIYKMINSGKLSYTSVVKHGRVLKLLIHQSLLECLVPL